MKFGGMIGNYPGTIWLEFGINRVKCQGHEKVKVMKMSKSSLNHMKFGGMIGYYPGTIWLDFGISQVKGQGLEKVNIFLP